MRKLCFGGSFNPIHHGHLLCARATAEQLGFDRVTLIPAALHPIKQLSADMAPAADRVAMCRLAIEREAMFEICDIELSRPVPSFTIETARQLRQIGWDKVSWLIGADLLPQLPRWHEYSRLIDEVDFVIMGRPGNIIDWSALPSELQRFKHSVANVPQIDISATDIRRRIQTGRDISYLTPPAVCDYIFQRGLYRPESTQVLR